MNTLEGLPILDHYKNLLATENEQHAWDILQEFFDYYGKEIPEEQLWYMLVMALGNSDAIEARHRSDMIFFYEHCNAFFIAAYLLHKHNAKQPG
jgi:hypothetical protein